MPLLSKPTQSPQPIEIQSSETFVALNSSEKMPAAASQADVTQESTEKAWVLQESQFQVSYDLDLPKQGFAIQLAAVQQISSLSHLWLDLKQESQVYLLKRQKGFVLLLGAFQSRAQAQSKMNALNMDADIWIRSWKNLPSQDFQRLILNDAI